MKVLKRLLEKGRSYERQGVEKVPGVHLGPHSMAVESKAEHQARQKGLTYEPRTYRARANAKAAEKNRLAEQVGQEIIEQKKERSKHGQGSAEEERIEKNTRLEEMMRDYPMALNHVREEEDDDWKKKIVKKIRKMI